MTQSPDRAELARYAKEHLHGAIRAARTGIAKMSMDIQIAECEDCIDALARSTDAPGEQPQLVGYVGSHGEIIAAMGYRGEPLKQGDEVYVLATPPAAQGTMKQGWDVEDLLGSPAVPATDAQNLPKLPMPLTVAPNVFGYTGTQMIDYARAALTQAASNTTKE